MDKTIAFRFALLALAANACGNVSAKSTDAAPGSHGLSISQVTPGSGPIIGGTTVTISGSGFDGSDPVVLIGGVASTDVSIVNENTLLARTPAADEPGSVDVTVFNSFGFGTAAESFEYSNALAITRILPAVGPSEGGNTITIEGAGFATGMTGTLDLTFGGIAVTDFEIEDDATLTLSAPPGELFDKVDISIANRNGTIMRPDAYMYLKPGLLAADGRSGLAGSLYYVDPDTLEIQSLQSLSMPITGLATTTKGEVFASQSGNAGSENSLAQIDLASGELVDVLTTASPIPDLTATPDGKLVGHHKGHATIYEIDTHSAVADPLAFHQCDGCGIAVDPMGRIVFIPYDSSGSVMGLNEEDEIVEVKALSDDVGSDNISALTFYGNRLFAIRKGFSVVLAPGGGGGSSLVEINLETGVVTTVGPLPPMTDALAPVPIAPPPPEE